MGRGNSREEEGGGGGRHPATSTSSWSPQWNVICSPRAVRGCAPCAGARRRGGAVPASRACTLLRHPERHSALRGRTSARARAERRWRTSSASARTAPCLASRRRWRPGRGAGRGTCVRSRVTLTRSCAGGALRSERGSRERAVRCRRAGPAARHVHVSTSAQHIGPGGRAEAVLAPGGARLLPAQGRPHSTLGGPALSRGDADGREL